VRRIQIFWSAGRPINRETGIRPSGASSILIPASEWIKKKEFNYPKAPQRASDFLSLSPLKFNNTVLLIKKLNSLKPRGKRQGEDDSPANKPYLGNIGYSGQSRPAFEHNRYHIFIFPRRHRIEQSPPDYCFMSQNLPPNSGGLVSVDPLHGPLHKSFRLHLTSGFMRRV
jgi:hypothetical protein